MSLDSLVTVNVSLQTTAPAQAGFGVPLVLGQSSALAPALTKEYDIATALTDMVTDGFATTDLEYYAVSAIASQSPRPTKVKVGRRGTPDTQAIVITVGDATSIDGKTYSVSINGTAYSVEGDGVLTAAEVAGAIEDLITAAGISNLTATDNADGTFDIDASSDAMFRVAVSNVQMDDQTADAGIATDLNTIVASDNDWYALVNTSQGSASLKAAAAWVETKSKIMGCSNGDYDVIESSGDTDVLSELKELNYKRTFFVWSHDPAQFIDAAILGSRLPTDPGSSTWKFKQLSGVAASTLTTTEKGYLDDKEGNYLNTINDVTYFKEGVAVGGEFIDVRRGIDWWVARVQERVYARLLNEPKVPGTDAGIAMIEAEIRAQNEEAVDNNVFASSPSPTVSVPAQADRSAADRASRSLTGITVSATLAGAIHNVTMNATISV